MFDTSVNPFQTSPLERVRAASDAQSSYVLLRSGPEVPAAEVELAHVEAIEVMVLWGSNVLHVAHLAPPRDFFLGESSESDVCDFLLPAALLGAERVPLVLGGSDGPRLVVPRAMGGSVELPGQAALDVTALGSSAAPSASVPGALEVPLALGARARLTLGDFVFQVAAVKAGRPSKRGLGAAFEWEVAGYFGASLLSFGGLVAALAYFVPPIGMEDDEGISKDRLLLLQQYLSASAERVQEQQNEHTKDPSPQEGGTGTQAQGESGALGKPESRATNHHYAVKGPSDAKDLQLAKVAARDEARSYGMVGLLMNTAGDPNAPTAPWGGDFSLGNADLSAQGAMWGDAPGESHGSGGLGLSGIGDGAGGRGFGIGLGDVGGLGHGRGLGDGQGFGPGGWGLGSGRPQKTHATSAPRMRTSQPTVSGRLPPEVIQRVVRQNFGRFRMCYEQGLGRNPNLEGRVAVRFVIGRDGAVSNVANGGSDLADHGVTECVMSSFYGISFPPPEGGIVSVVYPLLFSPG
jgi:hypothetical protein